MDVSYNQDLVNDIANKRIVLFVGAGASKWAQPRDGARFKDWKEFLLYAAEYISKPDLRGVVSDRVNAGDYLIASELIKDCLDDGWSDLLTAEFMRAADVSRLHAALISLNQRIIITTNFDKLIESAWDAAGLNNFPKIITKIDHKVFRLFRDDNYYLIKLHGSVDDVSEITFDKSSYQKRAFSNSFYKNLLDSLLLTHTFLFIGFSMDDPAVSLIIEQHAFKFSENRPHYILLSGDENYLVDGLSKKLRKLCVIRYKSENNHERLAEYIEGIAREGEIQRKLNFSAGRF